MQEYGDEFLREALRLAEQNVREGTGGPFGAVIVREGQIVARGANAVTTANDPTAHAEIVVIREACRALGTFQLQGCALYTSCEPCPMCLAAIYWARIERVYYAGTRAQAASAGFDDEWLYAEIAQPLAERSLPLTQHHADEAEGIFRLWRSRNDKVPY